ncbi:hypothetical protein UFOVP591_36 [uncultured Caudovirales phage]|jgi:hypothetical protein|uniref:Uncharacterized protein n=1 Tax=uncultured Caudovirales phage TaxID=2100421 RepID=A0A6J5N7U1_9CAUD|nr:hypothetical protein UFOVP591_36 [uncultured Caudovirales phage]
MTTDEVSFHVASLYGAKTKQGIVEIKWGSFEIQLSILEAKKIAYMILEGAESAATDQALMEMGDKLNMPLEVKGQLLMVLRDIRNKTDSHFFED